MPVLTSERFQVVPIPEWVEHEPYDATPRADSIQDGICLLLRDTQIDITGQTQITCHRVVYQIASQAGAERGARFSTTFDPALQHMAVHHIRVIRQDVATEYAASDRFDLMRREQNLERRLLDGRLTANLIIPDVRPGDIIDSCWTVYSDNPVLCGFYSDWIGLDGPNQDIRIRLRAPGQRRIVCRTFGEPAKYERNEESDIVDHRWSVLNALRFEIEALTPPWQILSRSVQISEDRDWASVSSLFEPYYHDETPPQDIVSAATDLAKKHPEDAERRMLEALALVRGKLRYLSLSLGEGGLIPRPLEQVWSTGYGDCKDSARLFVALCRALGIEATGALVSTRYGMVLNEWLPSPTIFDHCIVRVRLDGKSYWIDPTRRVRESRMEDLFNPHLGWALPLTKQDGALEHMDPPSPRLLFERTEKLAFGAKVSAPATLDLTLNYHAIQADWMRDAIANQGIAAIARHFEKTYRDNWPSASETSAMQVEDDLESNSLRLRACYTISAPWSGLKKIVSCNIPAQEIGTDLARLPRKNERNHDIFLGTPRILRRRLEIRLPRQEAITGGGDFRATGLKFLDSIYSPEEKLLVQEQELTVSLPSCPPDAANDYCDVAEELTKRAGLSIRLPVSGDRFVGRRNGWDGSPWAIFWIIWMILSLIGVLARVATTPSP